MATTASLDDRIRALFAGDAELTRDPYPLYADLRSASPVHPFAGGFIVTAHAIVKEAYRRSDDFGTSRASGRFPESIRLLSEHELALLEEVNVFERKYMSSMNGEDHRRVRGAAQRAFTPKRLQELRDVAQALTDDLLDRLARDEVADLIELCYTVPLLVIGDMLGAPREDADKLKRLGDAVSAHKHFSPIPPEAVHEAHRGIAEFRAYAHELIERNRDDPNRTALAAALLDANEQDRLTEDELAATMVLILFAGHETTTNLLGNGTRALMIHRDQWDRVCADPSLVPNAVEELLRHDSPVTGMGRVAERDTELAGVEIPAGTALRLMNAAANRDPEVFADPDGLDVTRKPIDHMSLGHGLHFCLGGPLARIEAQVVFSTLARRFPGMELAVPPEELEWNGDPQLRGLKRLPVRLA